LTDSLFTELKRRNVFKVVTAYLAGSWLAVEVGGTLLSTFAFDESIMRLIIIILAIGLIPVLILSWLFEITPDGIKKESEIKPEDSIAAHTGHKLNFIIIGLLVISTGYFIYESRFENADTSDISDTSIAVLPFVNMSSDSEQEYFSDGITEEILNLLVKITELNVTSRTSVFTFKGQNVDIPTVAEKLGVAHILEGSVRKAGNMVRITAQLIEAGNDVHLWSETYDRKLDDVFAIQDEIASEVVKALQVQLLGKAPSAISTNTEAYNLYLKGKHFNTMRTKESKESAVNAYQKSIELDPDFAPAWAGLSVALRNQGYWGITDLNEAMEASREATMHALELDDKLAEAWMSLATIQFRHDWDWSSSDESIRTALKHGPKNAPVLRFASYLALVQGEPERALDLAQLAASLDPLEKSGLTTLAMAYWATGRQKEEEELYWKIIELYPEETSMKAFLAAALARQGRAEEGLQYLDFESKGLWHRSMSAIVLHRLGRHEEEILIREKLIEDYGERIPPVIAMIYAWHGDRDKAFEWLEISFEHKHTNLTNSLFNPWLEPLYDDPRWEVFLDKIGLLKYWKKQQAKR